jgi:predicted transcriptional regulator
LQLAIMSVLWNHGETTIADIHERLRRRRRVAQQTVATLLVRLEDRGLVSHKVEGRAHVYRAEVSADAVKRSVVADVTAFTSHLFDGDIVGLVNQLLSTRAVDADDLARARAIIAAKERELRAAKRKGKP